MAGVEDGPDRRRAWRCEPVAGERSTVVVASRLPAYAHGLLSWLRGRVEADVSVVTGDARSVAVALDGLRPTLVLATGDIDIALLASHIDRPQLIVLVAPPASLAVEVELLRQGATGVLAADATEEAVVRAVQDALKGASLVTAEAVRLLAGMTAGDEILTHRQREILGLLDDGLTMAQVAKTLSVAPSTVKTHVQRIRERLGVRVPGGLYVPARLIEPSRPPATSEPFSVNQRTTGASSDRMDGRLLRVLAPTRNSAGGRWLRIPVHR